MKEPVGVKRLQVETQILDKALRVSLEEKDSDGMLASAQELFYLYPDLAPPSDSDAAPESCYDLLSVEKDSNDNMVLAAYLKAAKNFLRENEDPRDDPTGFFKILNAGITLRKPRLRRSHDLTLARMKLQSEKRVIGDGSFAPTEDAESISFDPEDNTMFVSMPMTTGLPKLLRAMMISNFISSAEVQALLNQMRRYPDIPVEELALDAEYITSEDLKRFMVIASRWDHFKP